MMPEAYSDSDSHSDNDDAGGHIRIRYRIRIIQKSEIRIRIRIYLRKIRNSDSDSNLLQKNAALNSDIELVFNLNRIPTSVKWYDGAPLHRIEVKIQDLS